MDKPELKGWLQSLLNRLNFREFLRARTVSRQWYAASKLCTKQWYFWLQTYGDKRQGMVICHDHRDLPCTDFANGTCNRPYHHHEWSYAPILLKTVPLEEQVMRQVMRRRKRKLKKRLRGAVQLKQEIEESLVACNAQLNTVKRDFEVYDRVLQRQTRTTKRTKIAIEDF